MKKRKKRRRKALRKEGRRKGWEKEGEWEKVVNVHTKCKYQATLLQIFLRKKNRLLTEFQF